LNKGRGSNIKYAPFAFPELGEAPAPDGGGGGGGAFCMWLSM